MKIKIYVATHKKFTAPKSKLYIPIHVGSEGKEDLGYLKDNIGDNISIKNSNFCELTGLYWIWKNDKSDVVGLTHYRRYFYKNLSLLNEAYIIKVLQNKEIIIPKKHYMVKNSIKSQYINIHNEKDYILCREIVEKKYPDYLSAFDIVFSRKWMYAYNMFIMRKKLFNKYAKWLFDILFELEKKVDISSYDKYNSRIYGFLSERLFNVWIEKNKFLLKEEDVFNVEQNISKQKVTNFIRKIFSKILFIKK